MTYLLRVQKQYLKFSSAHFTLFPDSRETLHGHNYTLTLEVESPQLKDGVVVNFVPLKKVSRAICDDLDEHILLPTSSRVVIDSSETQLNAHVDRDYYSFPADEVRVLPIDNITCEALAAYISQLLKEKRSEWDPEKQIHRMRIWVEESPGQQGGVELTLT